MLEIPPGSMISVDTETTGLSAWKGDRPFAISFCNQEGETGYVRWQVDPFRRLVKINRKEWLTLRNWFADDSITRCWFNGPFDRRMLAAIGIEVRGRNEEVMASMFLAKPDIEVNVALKPLAERYLGIDNDDEDDLKKATQKARRLGEKKGWKLGPKYPADYFMAPPELLERYARQDALRTMMLWLLSSEWLRKNNQWDSYETELAVLPITTAMVDRGVTIDRRLLNGLIREYQGLCAERLKKMKKIVGQDFEPTNTAIAKFLYTTCGFPMVSRTRTGKGKTDWQTLRGMSHPLIPLVNEYRVADKCLGTYLLGYKEKATWNENMGVLHPDWVQFGPHTGRYSCREPNLQNTADTTATRSSLHSTVLVRARECIVPRKGYVFLHFDQEQVEPRIFADKSQDPEMLKAFAEGRDIHTENTNRLWGWNVRRAMHLLETQDEARAREWLFEEWNNDLVAAEYSLGGQKLTRGLTKAILFVKFYGGGPDALVGLMQDTVTRQEAAEALEEFDHVFPNIRRCIRGLEDFARKNGYVETAFGRRVVVDPGWLYRATNYFVQGTAADFLKHIQRQGVELARRKRWDVHLVLTLHDELAWEWPVELLRQGPVLAMKCALEDHGGVFCLDMPVSVEIARKSWGFLEPLGSQGIANLPK